MTLSVRPWQRPQSEPRQSGRSRRATPLALLLVGALLMPGLIEAPGAAAASCEIPAAVGARTTATRGSATPDAGGSGIIEIEGVAPATPAALPAATPVAPEPGSLEVLGEELTDIAESLAACLTAGDARMVTELAGERYLGQIFGSSVPLSAADYRAIASDLSPVPTRILAVEEVAQSADDRATAVVTQVVGNQVLRAEWTFVPAERGERRADRNPWKLSFERTLPVAAPRGADAIEVEIEDLTFTIDPVQVAGPDLVLRGNNVSAEDHEMLVLKMEAGMTTSALLRAAGPDLPSGVVFVGEIPVRAGHEQDLVLVDLDPGTYTIVCLFPDADGVPHLALGMEATFTVG